MITGMSVRVRKGGLGGEVHLDNLKVFIPREEQWIGFDSDLKDLAAVTEESAWHGYGLVRSWARGVGSGVT